MSYFPLLLPKIGDIVVSDGTDVYQVIATSARSCEGCGQVADLELSPVGTSTVPVASVAYCNMDLAVAVSDPSTPDVLFRRVS